MVFLISASEMSWNKIYYCVDLSGLKIAKSDLNLYGKGKTKGVPLWFLKKNCQAIDLYGKMYGMLLIRYMRRLMAC